jgi:hypothetical protein
MLCCKSVTALVLCTFLRFMFATVQCQVEFQGPVTYSIINATIPSPCPDGLVTGQRQISHCLQRFIRLVNEETHVGPSWIVSTDYEWRFTLIPMSWENIVPIFRKTRRQSPFEIPQAMIFLFFFISDTHAPYNLPLFLDFAIVWCFWNTDGQRPNTESLIMLYGIVSMFGPVCSSFIPLTPLIPSSFYSNSFKSILIFHQLVLSYLLFSSPPCTALTSEFSFFPPVGNFDLQLHVSLDN